MCAVHLEWVESCGVKAQAAILILNQVARKGMCVCFKSGRYLPSCPHLCILVDTALDETDYLETFQSSFRLGLGTDTVLIAVSNDLRRELDKGKEGRGPCWFPY